MYRTIQMKNSRHGDRRLTLGYLLAPRVSPCHLAKSCKHRAHSCSATYGNGITVVHSGCLLVVQGPCRYEYPRGWDGCIRSVHSTSGRSRLFPSFLFRARIQELCHTSCRPIWNTGGQKPPQGWCLRSDCDHCLVFLQHALTVGRRTPRHPFGESYWRCGRAQSDMWNS